MAAPGDGLHPNLGVLLAAAFFSGFRPAWDAALGIRLVIFER